MKTNKMLSFAGILLAFALPAIGQERGQPAAEDRGSRSPGGDSGAAATSSMGSRGISIGDSSGASSGGFRVDSRTAGTVANFPSSSIPSGNSGYSNPNFTGTSFYSYDSYYQMQNFLWHLRTHYYGLDPRYGMRFLRNREPLLTPQLLKMALREPVNLSRQLVRAVDELEVMLLDRQAGKPVNKQEIAAKTQSIRELAKKIRQDHSMVFVDQLLDKNTTKGKEVDNLGLEAIGRLREMTLELNNQLKEMYDQTKTSIVSVGNLSQPSIESLSKGIEKLSKVIENSARRL